MMKQEHFSKDPLYFRMSSFCSRCHRLSLTRGFARELTFSTFIRARSPPPMPRGLKSANLGKKDVTWLLKFQYSTKHSKQTRIENNALQQIYERMACR